MTTYVLASDTLAEEFDETKIESEIVVCRKCLIEGDFRAKNLEYFWNVRAGFINITYGKSE